MSAGGPKIFRRCARCGKKREFVNSGKFRVNVSGNLLDVWLIFKCNTNIQSK